MTEDAKLKLELRVIPTTGEPDAAVFDDLIRLIQQGILTAPKGVTQVSNSGEFIPPADKSQSKLETVIRHRIEQTSAESRTAFEKRKEIETRPESEAKMVTESLEAAQGVVSAVQRAMIRGIAVQV